MKTKHMFEARKYDCDCDRVVGGVVVVADVRLFIIVLCCRCCLLSVGKKNKRVGFPDSVSSLDDRLPSCAVLCSVRVAPLRSTTTTAFSP